MSNIAITTGAASQEYSTQETKQTSIFKGFSQILDEMSESGEISFDESELDQTGTMLKGTQIILPTMANIEKLASGMEEIMDNIYKENGFPEDPPVELTYSYSENKVKVVGDREDAQEIEDAINSDPDKAEYVRSFLALSSHAAAIQEPIEFQEEYRNSNNPDAVVAKYAHLFDDNRKYPEVSYMYGSESSLLSDGQIFSREYLELSFGY